MQRVRFMAMVLGVGLLAPAESLRADIPADQLADQVRQSIERGVNYLKRQQRSDGTWADQPGFPGGVTSLCTLALLSAGVPPEDPAIEKALASLRRLTPEAMNRTYSVALHAMALCRAGQARDLPLVTRDVRWLERTQTQDGNTRGGWTYMGGTGAADNSNSQFAVLALYEAERFGVQVDPRCWQLAKDYWESGQNDDGSWGYHRRSAPRGSMTCAGIGSLIMVYDAVRSPDAQIDGQRVLCCRQGSEDTDRVQRGLEWLATNFSVTSNPQFGRLYVLYYLYGLERVGRLTNRRFLGSHDWYREGAAALIEMRTSSAGAAGLSADYWTGATSGENDPRVATSFALLFLAKGRRPVLLAKLKHGPGNDWNQHRSDVDNLTRHAESKWGFELTWQTVDLDAASVDDLVQSPVLFLSGSQSPLPASAAAQDTMARKLREYLNRGGFLLAEATCSGGSFDAGFRELLRRMFSEPEYALRLLPPEHPIWRAEEPIAAEDLRPLLGVEFGCRTSVVYCPPPPSGQGYPSLSCLWELSRLGRRQKPPAPVQRQINAGLGIGVNILAYATNRQVEYKYAFFRPAQASERSAPTRRGILAVASLRHVGGCTAAPRALPNLLQAVAQEAGLRIDLAEHPLNATDPALFDYPILFVHGRSAFQLTPAERAQLRTYVERGGTILADAICASRAFADSFRREMKAVFADRALEPIPPGDPMFTTTYGGFDLSVVTRRDPQPAGPSDRLTSALRKVPPEMEGVRLGQRWAVVFSPYDLSCALEKHDSMECQGYVREDAARIGINVILYWLQQ